MSVQLFLCTKEMCKIALGPFYMKGVEQFQQALEISPDCVPAQYGHALGLLGLAKDCINLGAYQWGASLLEVFSLQIFVFGKFWVIPY